jgi:transcriptional regulator with XRE-family HTH domain
MSCIKLRAEKLEELLDAMGARTNVAAAELLGMDSATISRTRAGKSHPSNTFIANALIVFAVTFDELFEAAEALKKPDPDMIVELSVGSKHNIKEVNLCFLDVSQSGETGRYGDYCLMPDDFVKRHQPGDHWNGRGRIQWDFIGKFDFIKWGKRDGRKVALLKHQ